MSQLIARPVVAPGAGSTRSWVFGLVCFPASVRKRRLNRLLNADRPVAPGRWADSSAKRHYR